MSFRCCVHQFFANVLHTHTWSICYWIYLFYLQIYNSIFAMREITYTSMITKKCFCKHNLYKCRCSYNELSERQSSETSATRKKLKKYRLARLWLVNVSHAEALWMFLEGSHTSTWVLILRNLLGPGRLQDGAIW